MPAEIIEASNEIENFLKLDNDSRISVDSGSCDQLLDTLVINKQTLVETLDNVQQISNESNFLAESFNENLITESVWNEKNRLTPNCDIKTKDIEDGIFKIMTIYFE
jgi:hypothetical protein